MYDIKKYLLPLVDSNNILNSDTAFESNGNNKTNFSYLDIIVCGNMATSKTRFIT